MESNDLEKALNSAREKASSNESVTSNSEKPQLSVEEEIGYHKGSLNTLASERNELAKMIGNVEAIMQAHLKRLEELGIKIN